MATINLNAFKRKLTTIKNMTDVARMLPDEVLIELEDFKRDDTVPMNKRKAAARVLLDMSTGAPIDVYGDDIDTILSRLVMYTSLDEPTAGGIATGLRGG